MLEAVEALGLSERFDNLLANLIDTTLWWDIGRYGGSALLVFLFFLL